jgi:hypothetical protein
LFAGQSAARRRTSRFVIARSPPEKETIGLEQRVIFWKNYFLEWIHAGFKCALMEDSLLDKCKFVGNAQTLKAKVELIVVAKGKTEVRLQSKNKSFLVFIDWETI